MHVLWTHGRRNVLKSGTAQTETPKASRTRRRRVNRGAEGAEGGRVWGGVSPSPVGVGSGEIMHFEQLLDMPGIVYKYYKKTSVIDEQK